MLKKLWGKKAEPNDTGFRDDYTEVDELALPGWSRITLYTLTAVMLVLLLWACVSKIDKIVKARGELVTTGREIVMRPLVDAIVKSIDLREGLVLRKDQKILTLDPTFAASDLAQVKIQIANAEAIIYRGQCEMKHSEFVIPSPDDHGIYALQHSIYEQRMGELNSRLQAYNTQIQAARDTSKSASLQLEEVKRQIDYAEEIRKMRQEVYDAGYDTKLNLLAAENESSRYKTQAESLQNTISSSDHLIQRLESEKNSFVNNWRKDISTEIAHYSNELDTYRQRLSKVELYSELVEMKAPQDCVVLEVGKIAVGSVAKTGEVLAKLVPLNEPLEVEARISPRDIGFIRHGDTCKIKIDAFPFQKHGGLKGILKSIGEDTLTDPNRRNEGPYYTGRITLESTKLNKVPDDTRLIPGMSLSAEIVVGKRTVISYILYPMISIFDESIREP